jgi:hypothetical protein
MVGRHSADTSIGNGNHSVAAWSLSATPAGQVFRCFRIVQWGPSAYSGGDGHELSCNGIELYGTLFEGIASETATDEMERGSSLQRVTSVASAGGFIVAGHRSFPELNGRYRREHGADWNGAPLYRQLRRNPGARGWQQGPAGLYFLREWCVVCSCMLARDAASLTGWVRHKARTSDQQVEFHSGVVRGTSVARGGAWCHRGCGCAGTGWHEELARPRPRWALG